MPRPDSDKYELTDAEKRDLTKLIKDGRPLPEKYRFLLFEDKREVELVWNGKTREVCTTILPFQPGSVVFWLSREYTSTTSTLAGELRVDCSLTVPTPPDSTDAGELLLVSPSTTEI
jgi:hypothetical protein